MPDNLLAETLLPKLIDELTKLNGFTLKKQVKKCKN
jgi:hypothetical protein